MAVTELGRGGEATCAAVPIEVMLVDDEDLVRRGFQQALSDAADISVVAETRVGAEAVEVARRRRPGVILVDAGLSRRDGTDIVRDLARSPDGHAPGVIVLTSLGLDDCLFHALKAGARGFLLKSVSQSELVYAVRAVAGGHAFVCPAMTRRLIDRFEILPPPGAGPSAPALAGLSRRETEVLAGIAVGKSNQEIARELHLTAATVKSHVSHILAKLGLPNRMHAALLAYRVGLVSPPW